MSNDSWLAGYVPWLAGIFAGAPPLAREFETGAYRFSFAHGVSGRRQAGPALLSVSPERARPLPVTGPPGSLLLSWRYSGPGGRPASAAILSRMPWAHPAALRAALAARRITYSVTYQPAGRYWLFQAAFAVILAALAVAMGYGAVLAACRRR